MPRDSLAPWQVEKTRAIRNLKGRAPTMRLRVPTLLIAVTIIIAGVSGAEPQAPAAASAAPQPTTPAANRSTWFFYKVKWGSQDEFLDLFQRNHYPVLKARLDAGHYVSIRTFTPTYHGDGRADWTFAVELVERAGSAGTPTEQEIVKTLYPDQEKFRREEQRRFELLEAHWDVPLTPVNFETRPLSAK
jgi:hypothetical protein